MHTRRRFLTQCLGSLALAPVLAHAAAARVPHACTIKGSRISVPQGYHAGMKVFFDKGPTVVMVMPERGAILIPDASFSGTLPPGMALKVTMSCLPDGKSLFNKETTIDFGSTATLTLNNPHTGAVIFRYKIIATKKTVPSGVGTEYEFEVQVVQV